MNYKRFLSRTALRRKPSAIRALQPLTQIPGMISLAGGMPNPNTFPIQSMTMTLKDGSKIELNEDISKALQYSPTAGLNELIQPLKALQLHVHGTNDNHSSEWGILVSNGSQSGLAKCFESILNEEDSLLVENPTYSGALAILEPIQCNKVPCDVDEFGIIPSSLEKALLSSKNIKALYTIPTGCNPSGVSLSIERKQQIYELACKYDFLIIEDDPYYYLNFSEKEFAENKSFLSMDREKRVIRFDSFSKIISAGLRIGFATGNNELINQLNIHQQATEMHASGLSQIVIASILKQWGIEGFKNHIEFVKEFYKKRCDFMMECISKYLKDEVEVFEPKAGMFVWMKLKNIPDSRSLIETKARDEKVLLVPGAAFHPLGKVSPYVRACFSIGTEDEIETGIKRLATILKNETQSSKSI